MRFSIMVAGAALIGLSGCTGAGSGPASMNTGVGFGSYQDYLRARENELGSAAMRRAPYSIPPERSALPPPPVIAARPMEPAPAMQRTQQMPAAVTAQPLPAPAQPMPAVVGAPLAAPITTAAAPLEPQSRQEVSNQQDFLAVLNRQAQGAQGSAPVATIQTAPVTGIPDPDVQAGPNIMAYALAFDHPVGAERFRRMNPLRWRQWENACLQFRTQEDAQRAFLSAGGPERDPGNLDPDGDGYACWWDPAPYRRAMQAAHAASR
jgi:hypothetical protein